MTCRVEVEDSVAGERTVGRSGSWRAGRTLWGLRYLLSFQAACCMWMDIKYYGDESHAGVTTGR